MASALCSDYEYTEQIDLPMKHDSTNEFVVDTENAWIATKHLFRSMA